MLIRDAAIEPDLSPGRNVFITIENNSKVSYRTQVDLIKDFESERFKVFMMRI